MWPDFGAEDLAEALASFRGASAASAALANRVASPSRRLSRSLARAPHAHSPDQCAAPVDRQPHSGRPPAAARPARDRRAADRRRPRGRAARRRVRPDADSRRSSREAVGFVPTPCCSAIPARPPAIRSSREVAQRHRARRCRQVRIVYGGVFPTYHWRDILARGALGRRDRARRGRGDRAAPDGGAASTAGRSATCRASPFATSTASRATRPAPVIRDLDAYRVGWELIDHARYSYWGGKRAVVVQFSRGCPHLCNYCGQRGFWTRWRHRDPVQFAKEIARLHREHGVEVINFADENPTVSKKAWRAFLEALIAENVDADPGRLDPRRRHRARRRHPASLQAGRLGALPARDGEHRRGDAGADPQGRRDRDRPRGDPPAAPARHPVDGDLGRRLRGGDRPRLLARPAPAARPTIPTRSRCSTSRRTAGRPTSGWPPTGG